MFSLKNLEERNKYYEEKIKLIKEHIKNPQIELQFNLKNFINNVNKLYREGKLNISEELIQELKEIEIIKPRIKRPRKSDKHKCKVLIEYKKNHPKELIIKDTEDNNGELLGWYKIYFQHKCNNGEKTEEIEELLKEGIIKKSYKEKIKKLEEAQKKYGISKELANKIFLKFGDVDDFVESYKSRKIKLSDEEKKEYGVKNSNFIILSSKDITLKEKIGYEKIVKRMEKKSKTSSKVVCADIDSLNKILEYYKKDERFSKYCNYFEHVYGINGKEKKTYDILAEENKRSKSLIQQKVDRIFDLLIKHNKQNEFIFDKELDLKYIKLKNKQKRKVELIV